jgi:glycosyltransferase involved in cell wall biosynthesis
MTLRVLHVLEALEGGTARHVIDVVRHAHGVDHEVVVPERRVGGLTDEQAIGHLTAAGATVHVRPMRRTPWSPGNGVALAGLARLVRRRRPDVVHGHSSIGGLLARLVATGARRPRIYTPNGITQVRVGRTVERALRPLTDRFVAVSPSEGELAVAERIADAAHLAVIPNGIELEPAPPIDLRAHLGLGPDVPLVGTIARLVAQKAPLDYVTACSLVAAEVDDAHFVLIGGGTQAREVDGAVVAAGLGARFHRVHALPGAAGALGSLDVFALTSLFEGGPYAPLESMRAGTAVVLTDVVGSRDTIVHGESGVLVEPRAPAAMAAAIVALLHDPDRRARFAAAGQARVAERFDVRMMGRRVADLYAEVADARLSDELS